MENACREECEPPRLTRGASQQCGLGGRSASSALLSNRTTVWQASLVLLGSIPVLRPGRNIIFVSSWEASFLSFPGVQ